MGVFLQSLNKNNEYVRILSIDGGGIRNLVALKTLVYLEKKTGQSISELFDISIGSTTGAFIACILNLPDESGRPKYTAQDLYQGFAPVFKEVFYNPWYRRLITLNGLIGVEFSVVLNK